MFLVAAALWCGLSLLRGQDPAPPPASNSAPLEMHTKPASIFQPSAHDYAISPDDLLDIHLFEIAEMSRTYRVSPSGSISLPLIPAPIAAVGLTPGQLSEVISERLRVAGLVSNPQVTVQVKESRLHSVAITGAVKKPQLYPVFVRTTLLDVLSQAEGLADDAANTATITRGEVALRVLGLDGAQGQPGQQSLHSRTVTVDVKQLLETGDPTWNLDLYPGDRVTVQRAGVFYVVGAVNRPGGFTLKDDKEEMTVLKAIALAQDLKSTAVRSKALIIRKKPEISGGREQISVNLKDVLSGRGPDHPLLANDIFFVPDSSSKKAIRRAAEAAVYVATGLIIWRR